MPRAVPPAALNGSTPRQTLMSISFCEPVRNFMVMSHQMKTSAITSDFERAAPASRVSVANTLSESEMSAA